MRLRKLWMFVLYSLSIFYIPGSRSSEWSHAGRMGLPTSVNLIQYYVIFALRNDHLGLTLSALLCFPSPMEQVHPHRHYISVSSPCDNTSHNTHLLSLHRDPGRSDSGGSAKKHEGLLRYWKHTFIQNGSGSSSLSGWPCVPHLPHFPPFLSFFFLNDRISLCSTFWNSQSFFSLLNTERCFPLYPATGHWIRQIQNLLDLCQVVYRNVLKEQLMLLLCN